MFESSNQEVDLQFLLFDTIQAAAGPVYPQRDDLIQTAVNLIFRVNPNVRASQNSEPIAVQRSSVIATPPPRIRGGDLKNLKETVSSSIDAEKAELAKHIFEFYLCKRTASDGDRHSGEIAFPGGRLEKNETDFQAAVRECAEEVGFDLLDTTMYTYVGSLPNNFYMYNKEQNGKPIYSSVHVWFHHPPAGFKVEHTLQPTEIADAFWHAFYPIVSVDRLHRVPMTWSKPMNPGSFFFKNMMKIAQISPESKTKIGASAMLLDNGNIFWGLTSYMINYCFDMIIQQVYALSPAGKQKLLTKKFKDFAINFHFFRKFIEYVMIRGESGSLREKILDWSYYQTLFRQFHARQQNSNLNPEKLAAMFAIPVAYFVSSLQLPKL